MPVKHEAIIEHEDEFANIDIDAETYDSYHDMKDGGRVLTRDEFLASMRASVARHKRSASASIVA